MPLLMTTPEPDDDRGLRHISDIFGDAFAEQRRLANLRGKRKKRVEDPFFAAILGRCHPRATTNHGAMPLPIKEQDHGQ